MNSFTSYSRFFTSRVHFSARALMVGLVAALIPSGLMATPRLLPEGQRPNDQRLQAPKDLDGYFPFTPSATPEAWAARSEELRRQILVSLGLWPMPSRVDLSPVIHGRIDQGEYTVEKVYFQSAPGFYVTGNLYRPKGKTGKLPGVLCPHGHWTNGRFYDNATVQDEIKKGAEFYEQGGRSVLQARCVQLARMGCVVFHYDMLGYADSVQIPMSVAHQFAKQRPEMNSPERWGLFSPVAESHLQSVMGLQTLNSIRSLDFLLQLPEVDSTRIGVTGASGGGTQTFILGAIDPRPTVAFPAVMVGTAMQGGCTCENACGLRVDTGNVEFAALFAPKPLGMTGADDWTKEMATKGFPQLQQHFAMLGKPEHVHFTPLNQFPHNYNAPSRAVMYAWMNRHLGLGSTEPIVEKDYKLLTKAEMSVWDAQHPTPQGGPEFEKQLLRWWHEDAERQIAASRSSPETYRKLVGPAIDVVMGGAAPRAGEVTYAQSYKRDEGNYWVMGGMLERASRKESSPVLFFYPKDWNGRTVIWLHAEGKKGLCDPGVQGEASFLPSTPVRSLLEAGYSVAGIDLLYQGEFLANGERFQHTPKFRNPRESAAYTFGYNRTVFAERVQDVLKLVAFVKHHERPSKSISLVGLGGAGHWAAAARAVARDWVDRAVVDTAGFRFSNVAALDDPDFLPGGSKYGDLPGLLSLASPGRLMIAGETAESLRSLTELYDTAKSAAKLSAVSGSTPAAAVDWLLKP